MTLQLKVILTIPASITLLFLVTFFFPTQFYWLISDMTSYRILNGILLLLNLIPIIYLLKRIWSFREIERSIKWNWTFGLILIYWIFVPIYIWLFDDNYLTKENMSV